MYKTGAELLALTVCLMLIASVAAGGGGHHWYMEPCSNYNPHLSPCPPCPMPPCTGPSPNPEPSGTSAYAYISSQSELAALKGIIDELGLQSTLSAPFAGTIFAPNNAALESYSSSFKSNVSYSTDAGKQFLDLFFGKLLSYHTLPNSVSASQLASGTVYNTGYTSINGNPHTVTYSGSGLVDEQQNTVALTGVGAVVTGGGYVHIISGVLQPNDIFPSLTAALTSSSDFSKLLQVVQKIDAGLNMSLVEMLENIAGTMAVPNNQAFDAVDIASIDAATLLNVVTYHFCAFTRYYRLLFTPFVQGNKPGKNPCLTVYSRANSISYGLSWKYSSPLDISVSYATGQLPDNLVVKSSSIVTADLSFPTHSAHVITSLLMPPTPAATNTTSIAAVKGQQRATLKVIKTLERLSNIQPTKDSTGGTTANAGTSKGKKSSGGLASLIAREKPPRKASNNMQSGNKEAQKDEQQQQQLPPKTDRNMLVPKLSDLVATP